MSSFIAEQPAIRGVVERMTDELGAKAALLIHENGQVLQRSGWIDESEYPAVAALVAAMIAAGKSLSGLGQAFLGEPTRFGCDSEATGLYIACVMKGVWVAVLYEQPMNPGQFRMKVRRYAERLARLGVQEPGSWEVPESVTSAGPGATLPLVSSPKGTSTRILTAKSASLFGNITDEEIDELFENTRS